MKERTVSESTVAWQACYIFLRGVARRPSREVSSDVRSRRSSVKQAKKSAFQKRLVRDTLKSAIRCHTQNRKEHSLGNKDRECHGLARSVRLGSFQFGQAAVSREPVTALPECTGRARMDYIGPVQ